MRFRLLAVASALTVATFAAASGASADARLDAATSGHSARSQQKAPNPLAVSQTISPNGDVVGVGDDAYFVGYPGQHTPAYLYRVASGQVRSQKVVQLVSQQGHDDDWETVGADASHVYLTDGMDTYAVDVTTASIVLVVNGPANQLQIVAGVTCFTADGTPYRTNGTKAGTTRLDNGGPHLSGGAVYVYVNFYAIPANLDSANGGTSKVLKTFTSTDNVTAGLWSQGVYWFGDNDQLWGTNGSSSAGTTLRVDLASPDPSNRFIDIAFAVPGTVYFKVGNVVPGNKQNVGMWASDGTRAGSKRLKSPNGRRSIRAPFLLGGELWGQYNAGKGGSRWMHVAPGSSVATDGKPVAGINNAWVVDGRVFVSEKAVDTIQGGAISKLEIADPLHASVGEVSKLKLHGFHKRVSQHSKVEVAITDRSHRFAHGRLVAGRGHKTLASIPYNHFVKTIRFPASKLHKGSQKIWFQYVGNYLSQSSPKVYKTVKVT